MERTLTSPSLAAQCQSLIAAVEADMAKPDTDPDVWRNGALIDARTHLDHALAKIRCAA